MLTIQFGIVHLLIIAFDICIIIKSILKVFLAYFSAELNGMYESCNEASRRKDRANQQWTIGNLIIICFGGGEYTFAFVHRQLLSCIYLAREEITQHSNPTM